MKMFKKLAAFFLSLSMCVSIAACNFSTSDSGSTGGSDSTPPVDSGSGGSDSTPPADSGSGEVNGELYIAGLEAQLKAANTVKMTIVSTSESSQEGSYHWSQNTVEYTIAKTEVGYDVYMKSTRDYVNAKGGQKQSYVSESYVINGIQYAYDEQEASFVEVGTVTFDTAMIEGMSGVMTETEEAQLKGMLAEAFEETVEITNSQATFAYDAKDVANDLVDYVGAIDPETKTLGNIVNDAIALVAEDVTIESIFAQIEALDTMTVGEAEAALDAFFVENADMTLQEFKQAILEDERVVAALTESGASADQIAQLKQATLKEILGYTAEAPFDQLVYDMVMMMTMSNENSDSSDSSDSTETAPPTYAEFIANIPEDATYDSAISYLLETPAAYLSLTVSQFAEVIEAPDMLQALEVIKVMDVAEMSATATITFGNMYNISKVQASAVIALTANLGGEDVEPATALASIQLSIDSISAQKTTISLPNAA